MVVPFLPKLKEQVIGWLVAFVVKQLLVAVKGTGPDADVQLFVKMVVLAFVHLAEAKMAYGPDKKAWVHKMLTEHFPVAVGYEDQVDDFIEEAVSRLNAGIKGVKEGPALLPAPAEPGTDSAPK